MKMINGNILNVKEGIICHQVNCQGVMGAGLALQIRRKWPQVYKDYRKAYDKGMLFLGNYTTTEVAPRLFVANLCGQEYYGRVPGRVYTDYNALANCLKALSKTGNYQVYLPYNIGCGFAGGDWGIVSALIDEHLPNAIVVRLG